MFTSRRKAKNSGSSSIKIVLGREGGRQLKVHEVSVKEGSRVGVDEAAAATKALKQVKAGGGRVSRKRLKRAAFVSKLDGFGGVPHNDEDFVNEQVLTDAARKEEGQQRSSSSLSSSSSIWRPVEIKQEVKEEGDGDEEVGEGKPHVVYELVSEDGFRASGRDPTSLWQAVFSAVRETREEMGMDPVAFNPLGRSGLEMLGLTHSALAFLLEQMPGAKEAAERYTFRHHEQEREEADTLPPENPAGCARAEPFKERNPLDMFSWLASRHRRRPLGDVAPPATAHKSSSVPSSSFAPSSSSASSSAATKDSVDIQLSTSRRATSLDLPMAMRFRHLAKNAKEAVGVYSSGIHGRGLYCKREIQVSSKEEGVDRCFFRF